MALKIEYMDVAELVSYENNSRLHSDLQVEQIVASIKEFGFTNPVLIDEDNILIAGHGRTAAAKLAGMDQVPAIRLVGLSDNQKKALRIADNQLPQNATWDMDLLASEIRDLEIDDFDIDVLGFDPAYLDEILEGVEDDESEGESESNEDIAPAPPENPVSQLGDVWVLGKHRLVCGDSTDHDSVSLLMNGQKASLVFTDPPYGVEYQSNMRVKSNKFDVLKNDDAFLNIVPSIDNFSKGWVFVWTSWKVQTKWIDMFEPYGYPTNIVVWHKPGGGIGDLKKTFSSDYEVALVWHRGAELCGKRIGSVWTINKDGASTYVHPTQKPVALPMEAIDKTTRRGDIVLDLFGGSGSTLIACENTGRKARLMELDPKYVDVIVKRWQDLTGKKAVHENLKVTFDEVADSRAA